ncbi:hypothetical protein ACFP81_05100 [Deinococcus lacus]|uniref:Uncharacterized protein n=1 Tax=Deinococcus lacus TaxID=392561 RepID=A0ABW1YAV9_9DEIO
MASGPLDPALGSRPTEITLTGQADGLYFQALDARSKFKSLSTAEALSEPLKSARMADGLLRVDIKVAGLPSQDQRKAYMVALRGKDGGPVQPKRASFVDDWKEVDGRWSGTLVYYFEPLAAGLDPNGPAELLLRTEADTPCAYTVRFDLSQML